MPQLPQKPREIDILVALASGASVEDMVAMQAALNFHDGNYNSFIACLRQYGASEALLDAVQAVIEDEMGMARTDIAPNDKTEHKVWGMGYGATEADIREVQRIEPDEDLKFNARWRFNNAWKVFGKRKRNQ